MQCVLCLQFFLIFVLNSREDTIWKFFLLDFFSTENISRRDGDVCNRDMNLNSIPP